MLPTVYISTILLILSMLLVGLDDIYMWFEHNCLSMWVLVMKLSVEPFLGRTVVRLHILKAFYGRVTLAILKGKFVSLALVDPCHFKLQFHSCGLFCFCLQPSPRHKIRQINETILDVVTYNYHIWGIFASPNYLQSTQKHFVYSF